MSLATRVVLAPVSLPNTTKSCANFPLFQDGYPLFSGFTSIRPQPHAQRALNTLKTEDQPASLRTWHLILPPEKFDLLDVGNPFLVLFVTYSPSPFKDQVEPYNEPLEDCPLTPFGTTPPKKMFFLDSSFPSSDEPIFLLFLSKLHMRSHLSHQSGG